MKAKLRTKIRRRSTKSGVRWYVSVVHPDGHEDAHGGYRTQTEAKAKARELIPSAPGKGKYVPPTGLTLGEYLTGEWMDSRANSGLSPGTLDVERTMIEAYVVPHLGDVALQEIKPRDLDRLYRTLRQGGGRGGKGLAGKTVRNVHVMLSKALGDAVRRDHLVANPVGAVDPPGVDDSHERTAWS